MSSLISQAELSVRALEDLLDSITNPSELPALQASLRESARRDVDSVTLLVKSLNLVERIPLLRRLLSASAAIKDVVGVEEWTRQGDEQQQQLQACQRLWPCQRLWQRLQSLCHL